MQDHRRVTPKRGSPGFLLTPLGIVLCYAGLASIWILCSDWLVTTLIRDDEWQFRASSAKGLVFVLLTATMLYLSIRKGQAQHAELRMEAESSRELLDLTVAAAHTVVWRYHFGSRQIVLSPNTEDVFHVMLGGADFSMDSLENILVEDTAEGILIGIQCAHERDELFVRTYEYRTRDGLRGWMEIRAALLYEDEQMVVGTATNVTERVELEQRVKGFNRELEARVEERTTELKRINGELDSFCHTVAHDLRAPLRNIDGFAKMLEKEVGQPIQEEDLRHLERIRQNAKRMARLIDDLISLARLARAAIRREQIDLSEMAQQIAGDLQRVEPQRGATFVIQSEMQLVGDSALIRLAMENLMGNAWKFTATRDSARIEVGMEHEGDACSVFVRDNGVGFDPRYKDRLFRPFERLHSASDFPGSGIGLASVAKIVALHGGQVWADAVEDEGATFRFCIAA